MLTAGLPNNITITNNKITWPDVDGFTAIRGGINSGVIAGNTLNGAVGHAQNAAASLGIPDWADVININSDTAAVVAILSVSMSSGIQKLTACTITDRGTGYTADFDVAVTGGGGSGATVRAHVTQDGRLAALVVTAAGSGYTRTPTLDLSAGAGTGGAATATIGVPRWAGRTLMLAAFGSQFRITSGSVINLPAPSGTTITVASQGYLTLRTLGDRWYPVALASGVGSIWPTAITLNNGPTSQAGAGSPEGVVTAPVGSTWARTDGGASTSFYVKESGSGNTGWIAK